MNPNVFRKTRAITFNIPLAINTFAPEVLYMGTSNSPNNLDAVEETALASTALPVGAALVVEILGPGLDPTLDANWLTDGITTWGGQIGGSNYAGLSLRVRAKSGGAAGPVTMYIGWTS